MNASEVTVLMIEDDSLDVELFARALETLKIGNRLVRAKDGVEGLEMLRGENGHEPITRPYIIVLDINMPRMDGIEFLGEIRKDEKLMDSVVFVMTTSDDEHDRYNAYNFNIAGYMVKSDLGGSFVRAIEMLDSYWKIVYLPNGY